MMGVEVILLRGRHTRSSNAGRTTALAALVVVITFLAAPWGAAGATQATLPYEATGMLGALDTTSGVHTVVFDTSTGIYSLDGVAQNDETQRRSVEVAPATDANPARGLWVFDFESFRLGPSTTVTAQGNGPLRPHDIASDDQRTHSSVFIGLGGDFAFGADRVKE